MATVVSEIVGREDELARIDAFLAADAAGARALVLAGEAGIGKTTVWGAAVSAAEDRGHRVLLSRSVGAEAQISFTAVGDLVEEVLRADPLELPAPRRRALEIALGLAEGPPPETRAIALALLDVLRRAAGERPVLVGVDDAQWLDSPSADALAFALRRLTTERVCLIATLRSEESQSLPLGLDAWVTEGRAERLSVGPLSLGATHRLVRSRLGEALPRRALRRVWEWSGGNPFYALEAARAVLHGDVDVTQPHALPEQLHAFVPARLATLPAVAREPLLAAAALSAPTTTIVARAVEHAEQGLEVATEAHVVEVHDGRIRFVHPLLASAVYAGASDTARRAMHARLAELVVDPEERARHLALSLDGPDPSAAVALERAAGHARGRGAPSAAAELLEAAIRATSPDDRDARARRCIAAAESHVRAGEARRARELLTAVLDSLPRGAPLRGDALLALGDRLGGDIADALRNVEQAVVEAGDDRRRRARALTALASLVFIQNEFRGSRELARKAVALAETGSDPVLTAEALQVLGLSELTLAEKDPVPILERGRKLAAGTELEHAYYGPGHWLAHCAMWADDLDPARSILGALYDQALASGDDSGRAGFCLHLTELECRAGDYGAARRFAEECLELAEQHGGAHERGVSLYAVALVEAYEGSLESARGHALEGLAAADRATDRLFPIQLRFVLGFTEVSAGDWAAAARHLEGLHDLLIEAGVGEPGLFPFIPDQVEALVALGRFGDAEPLVDWLEGRGRELDRARALATAARCRGLLAAARGDLEAALPHFDRALAEHERLSQVPFERARTLLVAGATQRRAKQKRAARESLGAARREFARLGAAAWVRRAEGELARVGGRPRSEGRLTPTERKVAALVAEGRSNKEVARELFVTAKTVEAHLSKVYAKLGVRSRTELAHFGLPGKD